MTVIVMSMQNSSLTRQSRFLNLSGNSLTYVLIRSSARRSLTIQIKETAEIIVYAPNLLSERKIEEFLQAKSSWILKKTKEFQFKNIHRNKKLTTGSELLFLGKKYRLNIAEGNGVKSGLSFDGEQWRASLAPGLSAELQQDQLLNHFTEWYRLQAKEVLAGRVFNYSRIMKLQPQNIVVRTQKRLWGSCHPHKKEINLNWKLIMAPMRAIDYVVVHELAHLKHANHSKRFWKCVENIMPDYKNWHRWLKEHSFEMDLIR